MPNNVPVPGEEADFKALNLIRSTKLHLSSEPAFLPNERSDCQRKPLLGVRCFSLILFRYILGQNPPSIQYRICL